MQNSRQQAEAEAQQKTPEDLFQEIFRDHTDPFLSLGPETVESQSIEEPLSQVLPRCSTTSEMWTKRKPEAFQLSLDETPQAKKAPQEGYNDQNEPVSTSSPKIETKGRD